jgi:hypothetical protein
MVKCPTCDKNGYEQLGKHLRFCDYPNLSDDTKETLLAQMIGDGGIDVTSSGNARLKVGNTVEEYIDYCEEQLPDWLIATRIRRETTHQDLHLIQTIGHPHFSDMYDKYYEGGRKCIEDGIELTPRVLRHWYASDGCFKTQQNKPTFGWEPASRNMSELRDIFEQIDVEITRGPSSFGIAADSQDSFFEYMEYPLPGFDYKWPTPRRKAQP